MTSAERLPTSIATGRECLAGERQANSGEGSETRAAVHPSQRLTVSPAGGAAKVDRDARMAAPRPHAVVLLIHPQQGVHTAVPRSPFVLWEKKEKRKQDLKTASSWNIFYTHT